MSASLLDERLDTKEELNKLELHVQSQLNGRVADVQLRAREEGLVIRGRARTYYAKQLAQQLVMTATTFPIAANEIEVA